MAVNGSERPEIVFFDVETTIPARSGQKFVLLEFGGVLVCPYKLVELQSFSTLIRPPEPSKVSQTSVKYNGITREAVSSAPKFEDVAERIYDLLNGKIWAGHNILSFDCLRIREAFHDIGREPPQAKGYIDSLRLLRQTFGPRAGNMKMSSLASYFGLGSQKHRSIEDVRMNLEVLKYCATVLFLESNFPDVLPSEAYSITMKSETFSASSTRSSNNKKKAPLKLDYEEKEECLLGQELLDDKNIPCGRGTSADDIQPGHPESVLSESFRIESENQRKDQETVPEEEDDASSRQELPSVNKEVKETSNIQLDPVNDISDVCERLKSTYLEPEVVESEYPGELSNSLNSVQNVDEQCNNKELPVSESERFLEHNEISISNLKIASIPHYRGARKMVLLHRDVALQMCSRDMRLRFCLCRKYFDPTGKPRLSIVAEPSLESCHVMKECDIFARRFFSESSSDSEWRPLLIANNGFGETIPAVRINILTTGSGESARFLTEFYQKDSTGCTRKALLQNFDIDKLDKLIVPGRLIDADYTFDIYDYQKNAGIRIVAKRLIVRC